MVNIVKTSVLTIVFGTLLAAGIYQTYYLFVPQNIAYGLKKEGYELSAYSKDAIEDEYRYFSKRAFENNNQQIDKPEALIDCKEDKKFKTNYIAYCKSLYGKPLSNKEEFEIARNWCAHKPQGK